MKRLSVSLALVIFLTSYAQSPQTLPDLVLKDVNGKNKNISDYSKSGKVTVISFWATWCTPCKKELTNINDNLLETWREKYNVTLVAVSIDNAKNVLKVKPYVDGQAWDFDVLLDVNEDLKRALNVNNVPYTIKPFFYRVNQPVYFFFFAFAGADAAAFQSSKAFSTCAL